MKQLFTFVLAAIAFVACTQNEVEELTANRNELPETLTVGFEGGDTRIELNEALKTVWTEGDEVSVFYQSYDNMRWAFQGATGDRSGELKRVSGEAGAQTMDNTIVVYPYNQSYKINLSNGGVEASLSAVQSYKNGSYGAEGNIMVAAGEFTQFTLKSVVGWLRVELTGEGEVVESVKVRGNDGEQVAGLVYINAADAYIALAGSEVEESLVATEVVLNCGDGVELGAEATAFYIALLPQTFEHGMTVEINYANGNYQTLVCENSITISRNHISPINIEANEEVEIPTNQLWYTATALVKPYKSSAFNAAIVSNEWDEATGEGIITFDRELTTIGDWAFYQRSNLTSVTIGDSVTTIGQYAFEDCGSLTSVTIGDSVTMIGYEAFAYCDSLTSVTIPDSVTTIGAGAFRCCDSLTSVVIPDSVTTIGFYAFDSCKSLTSVTIGDSVTTIAIYAFYGCRSLTSVTIGDSVTSIGYEAFYYCDSLTSVTIPDSVKAIGEDAFSYCDSLTSVTIGNSVTTIGNYAFYNCDSLTSVTIPDSVTTIGNGVFASCDSLAEFKGKFAADGGRCLIKDNTIIAYANASGTTYTIPDSVTSIGEQAFRNCDSLTSVTIGNSVTTIGGSAFYGCDSLTSVTIPDSVTSIGEQAFRNCDSLTSVTIGDSVTTIGNFAFYACHSLAEFKGKFAADDGRCLIKDNAIIAYAEASGTTYTIPDSVTTIGKDAFYECDSLTSVTIPDSVTTIGDEAFEGCSSLTSVYCKATTPPTLGGRSVFDGNKSGRKIYVPAESVKAYKSAAYWSDYAADIVGYDVVGRGNKV